MKIEAQDFLRLVKKAGTLASWDIESTGLGGDYNSVLVVSVKTFGISQPRTFTVKQPGNDQRLVREARDYLNEQDCWITYYGKGFDVKMLNTRLIKWGLKPLEKKPHLDMYFQLAGKLLTKRKSQGHLLNWLEIVDADLNQIAEKMTVSAEVWNQILVNPVKYMKKMVARCESDTRGLENLFRATEHLIADITR